MLPHRAGRKRHLGLIISTSHESKTLKGVLLGGKENKIDNPGKKLSNAEALVNPLDCSDGLLFFKKMSAVFCFSKPVILISFHFIFMCPFFSQ